jgi:hypothetical protein
MSAPVRADWSAPWPSLPRDLEERGQEGDYFFSLNRFLFLADRS